MGHCHTSTVVLQTLQNLLEIVWRIFKVNFLYFSIHLSHSATQRFAETASGSGGIIEHMKSSLVSAKKGYSVPLHHSSEHFDYFGDIKYWK